MTTQELCSAIHGMVFTSDEILQLQNALKTARTRTAYEVRTSLTHVGQEVSFKNSKTGQRLTGTLKSVGPKNAKVQVGFVQWRVPVHMLQTA